MALDTGAFPFGAVREIAIGYATAWAVRRTYVGELGWELYVPTELAAGVYNTLREAGADLGLRDAGYYALESLRLEKGYRAWGRELTPDYNPFQAGLTFAVKFDQGDFIGRETLLAERGKPPVERLLSFAALSSDTPLAHGASPSCATGSRWARSPRRPMGIRSILSSRWVTSRTESSR